MQHQSFKASVLLKLEEGLSEALSYHSVRHTRDVLSVCEARSKVLDLSTEDTNLLLTAAVLHDSGFLNTLKEHEKEGARLARIWLPDYGYSQDQIDLVVGMIMATKIPQSPKTQLEEIICDADLDYLGRDDFYTIGEMLFLELKEQGIVSAEKEWDALQVKFLSGHSYHTDISIRNRDPQKKIYLEELLEKWK